MRGFLSLRVSAGERELLVGGARAGGFGSLGEFVREAALERARVVVRGEPESVSEPPRPPEPLPAFSPVEREPEPVTPLKSLTPGRVAIVDGEEIELPAGAFVVEGTVVVP